MYATNTVARGFLLEADSERLGDYNFLVGVHQVVIGHARDIVGDNARLGRRLLIFGAHGIEPVIDSGDLFVGAEFFEAFFQNRTEHRLDFLVLRRLFRVQVDILVVPIFQAVQRLKNIRRKRERFLVNAVVDQVLD